MEVEKEGGSVIHPTSEVPSNFSAAVRLWKQSILYLYVCLSVCVCVSVFVREHISGTTCPVFAEFCARLSPLPMAVDRSSSDGVAMC